MAAKSREDLIAEWRERLAAAQSESADSSADRAWLLRVKIRLYQFLLSLYGEGHWNADAAAPHEPSEVVEVVFDSADALPLAGKPAKDKARIRSVLSSVAGASEAPSASGPWIHGLSRDEWIVVVTPLGRLDVKRCVQLLDSQSIVNRLSKTGSILVPRDSSETARKLIYANAARLRRPHRVVLKPPFSPAPASGLMSLMLFVGMIFLFAIWVVVVLGAIAWFSSQSANTELKGFDSGLYFPDYYPLVWIAVGLIWVSVTVAALWPKRKQNVGANSANKQP